MSKSFVFKKKHVLISLAVLALTSPFSIVSNLALAQSVDIATSTGNYLAAVGTTLNPTFNGGTLTLLPDDASSQNFLVGGAGGTLGAPATGSATLSGVFSGIGGLTIDGAGTVVLSGANTFLGGTTINTGSILQASSDGNLGFSYADLKLNGGTLGVTQNINSSRNLNLLSTGTINVGTGITLLTTGGFSGSGAVNIAGEGTLTINGVSSNTGSIDVGTGSLIVGDTLSTNTATVGGNITVGPTAQLSGFGTVGSAGSTLTNNGGVAPGSATLGNLRVLGNYVQTSNAYLGVRIAPEAKLSQPAVSLLSVGGSANLNGGLVVLANQGSYRPQKYTVLTAAGGITGKFTSVNTNLSTTSNLSYEVSYDANDVYLTLYKAPALLSDTQASVDAVALALKGVLALENASLVASLNYDCTLFDKRGICISAGVRNTSVSQDGLNKNNGLLIAGYKLDSQWRVGAFVDQDLSAPNSMVTLGNNSPMFGAYINWSENTNGAGLSVRSAASYVQKSMDIARPAIGTSDGGKGSSSLTYYGLQSVGRYGIEISRKAMLTPYSGLRYTAATVGGYTEKVDEFALPLRFSNLNNSTLTAIGGVEGAYKLNYKTTLVASLGIETDLMSSAGSVSGQGQSGLKSVAVSDSGLQNRGVIGMGAYYDLRKDQRVGVSGVFRQEMSSKASSAMVLATYTFGF